MMKEIEAYFKKNTYAELTGIQLLDVSEGRARAMLEVLNTIVIVREECMAV